MEVWIADDQEPQRRSRPRFTADVMLEKQIEDYWNVDGKKKNCQIHGGYTWSPGRLTRKQTTSRLDDMWPDVWKFMSDTAKTKAKQRWAIEKRKLDNARQLRGIFFIEPNYEEFKLTVKAVRRKLEVPILAAMPGKIPIKRRAETLHRFYFLLPCPQLLSRPSTRFFPSSSA